MTSLTWHIGDARAVLATLPAGSVNCLVTSPPYLAKRAYLPADHPDKPLEQGQEATPAGFLAALLELMDLGWDVLADDGVAFINLGDTASGSGGAGGDYNANGLREGQQRYSGSARKRAEHGVGRSRQADEVAGILPCRDRQRNPPGWPRAKSVCWVPELFGASLAYGRNLLSGEPCRQWVTRPPMTRHPRQVSRGVGEAQRYARTELVVMATKRGAYWFDLDPVRTAPKNGLDPSAPMSSTGYTGHGRHKAGQGKPAKVANEKGVPPVNWMDAPADDLPAAAIGPPGRFGGAHYAVMPPWLARLLITVGCPPGGTVLDPYAGSGTTLAEALVLGRNAVGVDLDRRNLDLARDRLGMFPLDVVDHLASPRTT